MKSLRKLTTILLLLMMMVTTGLTVSYNHGDDVCMVCACSTRMCSFNAHICCYEFDTSLLERLAVNVNCSRPDHAYIIDPDESHNDHVHGPSICSGFNLVHEYSCLTEFPEGYCKYVDTRAISMSFNSLSQFPDLQCLSHLGRLDLRHNKLTSVPHGAFAGLSYIRDIFLDHNEIDFIHPHAFDVGLTQLIRFSVSHNRLLVFEASWSMALHQRFCHFTVSHNLVHEFTNQGHWKLNMSSAVVYGPGFVDFSYNRIEYGPSRHVMSMYGVTTILHLAKFMKWGFDFRHNPLRCDCDLYEVMRWTQTLARAIWRDYFNVTCGSPPGLRGLPSLQLPLTAFVCELSKDCPRACHCQDQPATDAINIFCDDVGLRALPDVLPEGSHLVIQMANNSVHTLPPRQYLTRTKRISLRGSGLKVIEKGTPHLLRKVKLVDLRDNELHHLPSTFHVLDPQAVHLDLHTLKCSCDLHWMTAWLHHTARHGLENITCSTKEGEEILLMEATQHDLCGDDDPAPDHTIFKISLIGVLLALMVLLCLLVVFRYEAQTLVHRVRAHYYTQKREHLALLNTSQFDVFITVDSSSLSDMDWVNTVLVPHLQAHGLSSYLPLRDCRAGSVEMDELTKRMQDSGTVLVVLSKDYLHSQVCLAQFRAAYNHMVSRKQGRLLIIKRGGQLSWFSVREPHLRAMLTLRMFYTSEPEQLDKALDTLMADQENEL